MPSGSLIAFLAIASAFGLVGIGAALYSMNEGSQPSEPTKAGKEPEAPRVDSNDGLNQANKGKEQQVPQETESDPFARLVFRGRMNSEQSTMIKLITREFRSSGFNDAAIVAAVINAFKESNLDPRIRSGFVGEDSVGLFQLNAAPRAAGAGMSYEERANPLINTRRIIEVSKGAPRFMAAMRSGESAYRLTQLFTEDIERPANRVQKGIERANFGVESWFSMAEMKRQGSLVRVPESWN